MAKLTRYTTFEALKSDSQPTNVTSSEREKAHADFEEFVKLLRCELAAKKKAKSSDER